MTVRFVDIDWAGRPARIEHAWVGAERRHAPLLVFLHEGLGSLAMWKDFPRRLCDALGWRGLVYSRPGHGLSTPPAAAERLNTRFMHEQAHQVLPALLAALRVQYAPWLLGHSDGGSIALLHAARHQLAGCIVLAPHTMVEDLSVASIAQARDVYASSEMRPKLAKYHADADAVFARWHDIWLSAGFRDWTIEDEIATIKCPLLAMQGLNDEYGTLEQIHGIARRVPQTRLLEIADCRHSPHRDQPEVVIAAVKAFVAQGDTARPAQST